MKSGSSGKVMFQNDPPNVFLFHQYLVMNLPLGYFLFQREQHHLNKEIKETNSVSSNHATLKQVLCYAIVFAHLSTHLEMSN